MRNLHAVLMSLGMALALTTGLGAQTVDEGPADLSAVPQLVLLDEAPSCSVSPAGKLAPGPDLRALQQDEIDPASCGVCAHHCSSDNLCFGRKIGDFCNNMAGICRAFDGCALVNCCRCSNAG